APAQPSEYLLTGPIPTRRFIRERPVTRGEGTVGVPAPGADVRGGAGGRPGCEQGPDRGGPGGPGTPRPDRDGRGAAPAAPTGRGDAGVAGEGRDRPGGRPDGGAGGGGQDQARMPEDVRRPGRRLRVGSAHGLGRGGWMPRQRQSAEAVPAVGGRERAGPLPA